MDAYMRSPRDRQESRAWNTVREHERDFFLQLAHKLAPTSGFAAKVVRQGWVSPRQAFVLRAIDQERRGDKPGD